MKMKKSFKLLLSAPIAKDGKMPKEIDEVLRSLREHPLLKRDFPTVEMKDLVKAQPLANSPPIATFNVICVPKVDKAAPKPEAEAAH